MTHPCPCGDMLWILPVKTGGHAGWCPTCGYTGPTAATTALAAKAVRLAVASLKEATE